MEANTRWVLLTALAPVAWGANYWVTHAHLPADHPLWGAALRALPAGLLLLALARRRPHGAWWWRSALLGLLNTAVFFVLLYLASQLLPTSAAATVMAASPLTMLLTAWALAGPRPRRAHLAGAVVGLAGVALALAGPGEGIGWAGLAASAAAMLVSSVGYVLAARWREGADPLAATAWQLTAGGLVLLPLAAAVEGPPPPVDAPTLLAFGYTTVIATALAFACWFAGLRHLPAGTVGLLGLLNPLTGVLLGTALDGDAFGPRQGAGLALVVAGILLGRPRAETAVRPAAEPAAESAAGRARPSADRDLDLKST
ncbi:MULTISPECIES: DMT family transporter [Streptomycetaceae]|uniref:DMT family transporter n=1 Tax=Streptomycetaceae TaxID=2062 RepID=UPI00093E2FFB|nr:EamA family transporter [Streptomyces sp. CB02056]OKH97206.1 ABC transporter permease [Streptomyces sp. CB02056]